MNKDEFLKQKESLIIKVKNRLSLSNLSVEETNSLTTILDILEQYTYQNRLNNKGLLTHTIIDSLSLNIFLEEYIWFDKSIS